jgi:phosphate transport system permease protein
MTEARLLKRRHRLETLFRWSGRLAVALALGMLLILIGTLVRQGVNGLRQTMITLPVTFDKAQFPDTSPAGLAQVNTRMLLGKSIGAAFPDIRDRREKQALLALLSSGAEQQVLQVVRENPAVIGTTVSLALLASDDVDQFAKYPERQAFSKLSAGQQKIVRTLQEKDLVHTSFYSRFFRTGDSREPEAAGVRGALVGSALTLMVTILLAFPIGVAAAIYLEEFAPRNRLTQFIEVNINNLAAVPSIIFGFLGLAVFLGWFGMPRSSPLVGGCVLALLSLPTIIIASRAALKAVPPSIRQAAQGLGASPVQVVFHHVVPCALPGILTGSIIAKAHALGETAPLLMIGMVAFIADIPSGVTSPATALPVQIYLWAESAERAYQEKTAAAILVLLAFLMVMNALAIWLRKRFEIKW